MSDALIRERVGCGCYAALTSTRALLDNALTQIDKIGDGLDPQTQMYEASASILSAGIRIGEAIRDFAKNK